MSLIYKPKQKILLNLKDPGRVTTLLPTARTFTYKGAELVAVPHRLKETRVLRTLGYDIPSPISCYYPWTGTFTPFEAQQVTSSFLTLNDRAFVLSEMGTGKSLSVLWALDYLRRNGYPGKTLIISPLSTLERTWADEIFRHFPTASVGVLHGSKAKRLRVLKDDYDFYLVNHDGVKVIEKELIERTEIDTIVIDEIASFRNGGTARFKALKRICEGRSRVWGLTGTPTPNHPTDAWAQVRLISPDRVPPYFGRFRDTVMVPRGPFKWESRPGATEIVAEAMRPSIRFTRDQCIDLPECLYQDRDVPLSKEQATAYNSMLKTLKFEHDQGDVLAVNEAVKLSKLLQICCGAAYGGDEGTVTLDVSDRVKEVVDIVEQAAGKVLVFLPFTAALQQVTEALREHWHCGMIYGGTSKNERDNIFSEFQDRKSAMRVLCANPGTLSHGLTLTAANTTVWFGPPVSTEQYEQANARITRPGQRFNQLIVHLQGTDVERNVYLRLKKKRSMQGLLLDILAAEV